MKHLAPSVVIYLGKSNQEKISVNLLTTVRLLSEFTLKHSI